MIGLAESQLFAQDQVELAMSWASEVTTTAALDARAPEAYRGDGVTTGPYVYCRVAASCSPTAHAPWVAGS